MREARYTFRNLIEKHSVVVFWIAALLLVPFLMGGVVVGDESVLLHQTHLFDQSGKSFSEFARTPGLSYIFHHLLWFGILYATSHMLELVTTSPFLREAAISAETIIAAMSGIALCYTFLVRRMTLGIPQSLATVLAFFAGGFGLYTFCLGGAPESYMVLVMGARLFFFEPQITERRAWKLAVCDTLLCAFKAYSLLFVVMLLPLFWMRAQRKARITYFVAFTVLITLLALAKLWTWNVPGTYQEVIHVSAGQIGSHFLQQLISPWTGVLFCLPVLLVLIWVRPDQRMALLFKFAALLCCILFFSFFSFFDGDVPGGRYIFPFLLVLVPEIGGALSRILAFRPQLAWLLPAVVLTFLPVAVFSFPFFPNTAYPSLGSCVPVHPAIYSWRIVVANITRQPSLVICFHRQATDLLVRDASTPRTGPWRVAYVLSGGHSEGYITVAHTNDVQTQHDAWGRKLSGRLRGLGLGNLYLWGFLGLLPAILVMALATGLAMRVNRTPALECPGDSPY